MRLRNLLFIGVGIIAGFAAPALADLTYTQGSGATIFDFVCFTTKHCSAHVPVNSAGTEIATGGNPIRTDPTGTTTQPVSAASLPTHGVTVASGGIASGGVASGAMVDLGAQADAAAVADNSTASLIALLKRTNQNLTTQTAAINAAIPTGTNLIGDVNVRQGGTALSATNPSFARLTDGTNAQVTDPCQAVAKINFTGSQTTGTQIIAGTSAKKTYICSIQLIAQAAEIVNIIAGTGSVCATGSSAVMGSTTAANGMSYAANGGFTQGSGLATVIAATAANADNVCITQSGSSRITYQLTYVQL